jgi:hypothetical protein|tara:strand:+ start:223 stop:897 length:675 start_codon:yes stop_codon:yes gene_type:complete
METYELLEQTAIHSQHIIQDDALNMVINSEHYMSGYELDKKIWDLFKEVEKEIWKNKINRKYRIERIVSIEVANKRPHAHILINRESFSKEKLKMMIDLAWKTVFGRNASDFTLYYVENRSKVGSTFYNNKSQLLEDSQNAIASLSTFIKRNADIKNQSLSDERSHIEKTLNKTLSNKTWNILVKQKKKQSNKEKNRLRLERTISQNRAIKKKNKHKQNNLAIA